MQGLAEVACVPLAGCGILGSAVALDKDIAKRLFNQAGLPTARAVTIREGTAPSFAELEGELGLPFFVKPARQGSSVGVSKVHASQEFEAALAEGFRYDGKLLAEEFVRGREIECAVLEDADGSLFVSRPGEIVPAESHDFYSYAAKYIDENGALLNVPADAAAGRRRGRARDGGQGLPRARLRWHGAGRLLRDGGRPRSGQRTQHDPRLHQYQHVFQGDGGKRRQLSRRSSTGWSRMVSSAPAGQSDDGFA